MRLLLPVLANLIAHCRGIWLGKPPSSTFAQISFSQVDRLAVIVLGGLGLLGAFLFPGRSDSLLASAGDC